MKKEFVIIVILLSLILFSCNNKTIKEYEIEESSNVLLKIDNTKSENEIVNQSEGCDDMLEKVKLFYSWYKNNYSTLHEFDLIRLDGIDSIYRVNFINTAKYLELVSSSNYFSDEFIDDLKNHIDKVDAELIETKQKDGPPNGLCYDLLLLTQEYICYIENYDSINVYIYNDYEMSCEIADEYGLVFTFDKSAQLIKSVRKEPELMYRLNE